MRTITMESKVWLSEYSSLGAEDMKPGMSADSLCFYSPMDDNEWKSRGYTFVGHAVIQFSPFERDEILSEKVAALRAQKTSVIAEAQAKATSIEEKIQKLLAITYASA